MYHKNGLFFAVATVVVVMLFAVIAPTPVSAQSDSAARVAIQGPAGEFGDVLLVKDGDDIIISGLSGAVSSAGKVTISADGMTPITVNASFVGHFPVKSGNPIIVPGGASLETATISFASAAGGAAVAGTIPLNITGDNVLQALRDYASEVDKVLKGEKTTIDQGMPPHILLDVTQETPTDPPLVGKVLLTQRLVVKKSGDSVSLSIIDQLEGISGAGLTPPIQSLPNISLAGVYGIPVDVDNPNTTKRVHLIDTSSFVDGDFVGNGYFLPFSIPDVNSGNVEDIRANLLSGSGVITSQIADVFYLRVSQYINASERLNFLAQIQNDVSAAIDGSVTVVTNNDNNAAGADALAVIQGKADPYALVTAYAANDVASGWLASAQADASGQFSLSIPPEASYDAAKDEFGPYVARNTVYLGVSDPFGNIGASLLEVTTDTEAVATESPVATPQADGNMIVAGRTEAGSIVLVEGRIRNGSDLFYAGVVKADADGAYTINVLPFYDYRVTVTDLAGNTLVTDNVPGDQVASDPTNLTASVAFPYIQVSGVAEPYASILSYGFDAGVVPDNPVASETLPLGAFSLGGANSEFPETTAKAGADGSFTLSVPASVGRYIYLRAVDHAGNGSMYVPLEMVDSEGNPLGDVLTSVRITSVVNANPGLGDTVNGQTVDPITGAPLNAFVVAAFARMTDDPSALIPFVEQLTGIVPVNNDGTFSLSIPDRSDISDEFVQSFYIVAFTMETDGTLKDVGFTMVSASDGFDRVGPEIFLAPLATDFIVRETGSTGEDMMNVNRIYPAGTGAGAADLPAGSLPYVFVLADSSDDDTIDVNAADTYIVDWKPLNAAIPGTPLPIPGVTGLNLGLNYWDAASQSVVGKSTYFIALMDTVGNFTADPIPVYLDVTIQDPVVSLIAASGSSIFADEGTVEANSVVSVFENSDKSGLIATTAAYSNGGFAIVNLSISQDYVYIASRDSAGNESNVVKVKVSEPVQGTQFMVLDEFGVLHTSTKDVGFQANWRARALSSVDGAVYALWSDGYITKLSGSGDDAPAWEDLYQVVDLTARDIEVISAKPFKAYVLLGNGVILTYGDVPFFGDLSVPDTSVPRVPVEEGSSVLFLDLNGNGVRDTEDANGNGILDISVGIGGVLESEDLGIEGVDGSAGNGLLDEEPIVDLLQSSQGFGWDIARDLELVKDNDGNVIGYVILDGFGVMWAYGSDIDSANVRPTNTNGVSIGSDTFVDLSLIVENGKIVDFISMNNNGDLFALPSDQGGVLGAGVSTDASVAGLLSADQYGYASFGFDIARDLAMNPADTNGDGAIDWQDGFYILDGFGGIHAAGGAPVIEDSPFLGLDIARDLEF